MAKSVKLRQGTDTEHAAFTGEMAEVTFDTTNNTIYYMMVLLQVVFQWQN